MDEGCAALFGAIVIFAIAVRLIWWVISMLLVGTLYGVCGAYLLVQFVAVNFFTAIDAIFYFDPNVGPVVSWILGGALIGLGVQGGREVLLRDERRVPMLLLALPLLALLWIVLQ